ncbi:MAG TPA: hypothetical protein VLM91_25480 [Candidatus Methylomirabilis sp.]|nr:hypothetical protein [Candidatus Methylomirabilis sp.]
MQNWNPWKAATIGLAVIVTTAVVTGLVVGNWTSKGNELAANQPAQTEAIKPAAPLPKRPVTRRAPTPPPAVASASATPSASDVEACNQYANSAATSTTSDKTKDVLTKAVIGGALGAGVGAAGGAIAGGGRGAGKGAAIGGIVGATAGTLFGLNEANQKDTRAVEAYRTCMKARGHTG